MSQPIYRYAFEHHGSFSLLDLLMLESSTILPTIANLMLGRHQPRDLGACHGDELFFLLDSPLDPLISRRPADLAVQRNLVDLWTNFATYHKPIPSSKHLQKDKFLSRSYVHIDWKPINSEGLPYARIFNDTVVCNQDEALAWRMTNWDTIMGHS